MSERWRRVSERQRTARALSLLVAAAAVVLPSNKRGGSLQRDGQCRWRRTGGNGLSACGRAMHSMGGCCALVCCVAPVLCSAASGSLLCAGVAVPPRAPHCSSLACLPCSPSLSPPPPPPPPWLVSPVCFRTALQGSLSGRFKIQHLARSPTQTLQRKPNKRTIISTHSQQGDTDWHLASSLCSASQWRETIARRI